MGGAASGEVLGACGSQEFGADGPLVIKTAPTRYFKPKIKTNADDDGWESDDCEEEDDFFEHFMVQATGSRAQAHKKKKERKASSPKARVKEKEVGFDHESTFLEPSSTKQGRHKSRASCSKGQQESTSGMLIAALKQGESEEVARMLRECPGCVQEKDQYGQTALFFATSMGNLDLVQAILDCRASVDCANKFGYTPLMRALAHGFTAIADELIQQAADISAKDTRGYSVLQVVGASGQAESVDWLLRTKEGAEQVHLRNDEGHTPLLTAVRNGHSAICHRILDARGDPNVPDEVGRTPLLYALASNDLEVALCLISSRADVNTEDDEGRSVLMALVVNILRHKDQRESSLCGIAAALEARADVEAEDLNGNTPLIVGARNNEPMLCAILIAYGADAAVTDEKDRTPLVIARTKGFNDVIRVLNEFGDAKTVANRYFDRLLTRAVYYGNTSTCKALLDRGADKLQTTKQGTPLKEVAARLGHSGVMKLIRDAQKADRHSSDLGAEAKKRKEALQVWLRELKQSSANAGEIQKVTRRKDTDGILSVVAKMTRALPTETHSSFCADLIAGFVRNRNDVMLRQVQHDLRLLRTVRRQQALVTFGKELTDWDVGNQRNMYQLQKVMAEGVSGVRGIPMSDFETSDDYTQRLEEVQIKAIDPVLRLAYEIPSIFAEEVNSKKMFPPEHDERPVGKLQCPKCMLGHAHAKALKEHVKYCQSKVGEAEEAEFRKKRVAKAESAIHVLEGCAHRYRAKGTICQSIAQGVVEQRSRHWKSFPEAAPVLQGCSVFVEVVESVCWHRESWCVEAASEASKSWGLDASAAQGQEGKDEQVSNSAICRACFVKPTSRTSQHKDGSPPCAVLCSACAFELGMKLKSGKDAICPGCERLMCGTALLS